MGYTLGQAAKATGKNRSTIYRAIKTGKISATQNAHSEWDIDPAELHRVYPAKQQGNTGRNSEGATLSNTDFLIENRELKAKLDAANERDRLKDQIIDDLKEDRNRWRQQATALLTDKQAANSPEKPAGSSRFWPWSRSTQKT
jgi:hypothetical protein